MFPTERNKRNIAFCVYLMYFLLLIKDLFVFFKKKHHVLFGLTKEKDKLCKQKLAVTW